VLEPAEVFGPSQEVGERLPFEFPHDWRGARDDAARVGFDFDREARA
jgi:hypothetical protein